MGTSKNYDLGTKTVTKFEYETIGVINGVSVIKYKSGRGNGAPNYSNTSKAYYIYNNEKKRITQVVFYDENNKLERRMDWEHGHKEFKKGTPHIQYFDSEFTRNPNNEELKHFNLLKENNFNI